MAGIEQMRVLVICGKCPFAYTAQSLGISVLGSALAILTFPLPAGAISARQEMTAMGTKLNLREISERGSFK